MTGGRRALGSLLVVDPVLNDRVESPATLPATDTAVLPLSGPAILVMALADNGLTLRRRLEAGLAEVEARLLSSQA